MPDIRLFKVIDNTVGYNISGQLIPMCEGVVSLLQVVVNHLMTTPGSDIFNPNRGGNLLNVVRRTRVGTDALKDALVTSVRKVEFDILEDQRVVPLSADERLVSLTFISATAIEGHPDHALISLQMKTGDGSSFNFKI